ncbi:MAG: hypothetical protein ACYS0K_23005 [Planctomycetota bacterium]|jgi:hypothetical protein
MSSVDDGWQIRALLGFRRLLWLLFWTLLVMYVAFLVYLVPFMREIGEEVGTLFGEGLEDAWRVGFGKPDLEVAPDTPGYFSSLDTVGPQRHYAKDLDKTTIAGDVRIGDMTMPLPVAEYDGRPRRGVDAGELRPSGGQFAVLVVRVVDDSGRQRGRTGVTVKTLRDTPFTGWQTTWEGAGDAGEVTFLLGPGTFSVSAPDARRSEVTLAMHERVWCTLSPSGLTIDERNRWCRLR